jgi:two-component system, chemotaxis family, CheB/CheR fusion protein
MTDQWMAAVKSGKDFNRQMFLKRHDGTYRWHHTYALPIHDPSGAITSWVCSSTDIHDQKMFSDELERQIRERTQSLKDSNIELEHSNKNLEQFAFIASHDLQEPLRKIKTFSSILSQNYTDKLPNEGKLLIEKINASSERMSYLIRDVLNFSQIKHSEHNFVKTDINDILKKVIGDFSLLIEEKNAEVNTQPMPSFEVIPLQINQLFYNLMSNALKFSKTDVPPVITVSSRTLTLVEVLKYPELNQSFTYCEILFSDNGIGFDERYKDKIFEMFQRLHKRQDYSGTGIGLALCKRIVLNHGGVIFGESRTGAGTLFHIILPINVHHPAIDLLPGYVE